MNRRLLLLFAAVLTLVPALAQSWDEVERDKRTYYSGRGSGATIEEADQRALAALISQISVTVTQDFQQTEEETTTGGALDATSRVTSTLQTYSSATLTGTERIIIKETDDLVIVGRYMKRSELSRIFEGRIRTLKELVRLGRNAEQSVKIDDALRYYYWAYVLLESVQRPAEVTDSDEESGTNVQLLTWLPDRITSILKGIEARVVGNDGTNVDLQFSYKGQPVSSLDYTFFDGRDWSAICSAKDGRGTMEFAAGAVPDNVSINYEYVYHGQAHLNAEVQSVMGVLSGKKFRGARVSLATGKVSRPSEKQFSVGKTQKTDVLLPVADDAAYRATLNKVIAAIRARRYDDVRASFTDEGWDMFTRLVRYGNARVLGARECTFSTLRESVIARSVPMSFSFKTGVRKEFVEDVVFTFDRDGRIDCIAFGLDRKAREDIERRNRWTPVARQTVIQFLENYKTAYALKRIDYLRTIFDDNAVIIVGHVAERLVRDNSVKDAPASFHNEKYIKRIQYSKEQYMKNLESCFRSNEFVNIRFSNNDVRRATGREEYGIQIKQDYYSTHYGDQGYLYLQVELDDPDRPVIKVRTWQPEPDPEIGLFGLGDW